MGQPKWTAKLHGSMPAEEAAKVVIRATLASVARRLRRAADGSGKREPERVHEMRVATRRAESAVALFEGMLNQNALTKVRGRLKRIRRAGAAARDGDVHLAELNRWMGAALDQHRPALEYLRSRAERERREAQDEIVQAAERFDRRRMKRSARSLLRGVEARGQSLLEAMRARMDSAADEFQAASAGNLDNLDEVHALRLSVKKVRYLLEMAAQCLHSGTHAEAYQRVERLQEHLGRVNDQHQAVARLERVVADLRDAERRGERRPSRPVAQGIGEILELCRTRRDKAHRRFLEFWRQTESAGLTEELRALLAPAAPAWLKPLDEPGTGVGAGDFSAPERDPAVEGGEGVRLAAIDVGTNSIRLIVAESTPEGDGPGWGGYRVLDDEKEVARLGRGLEETGRLSCEAMENAATTIARMREIAEGYGVRLLRAVGTCAVREAQNRDEFVDLVRRRSGLELDVISAEEEAKLAFLSASTALDLRHGTAAVIDIGGGSTEIVLSAAGAIERVYTIPLGAVRLTERFGGAEAAAGERYKEMREAVRAELKRHIGRAPMVPRLLVGTGGTATALAAIAAHQELGPAARGLFAGSVQGREVRRWEVKHLLENLREMPLKDRAKVGGLAADRADIIVAGLVLVDATMKRLGVDTLVAHEGGIRDGLLLTMLREWRGQAGGEGGAAGGPEAGARDPMRSVRRFAKACGYEHRHCGHVARLSMQLFDQLAADPATADPSLFTAANRALLEAAALIHDVGYLINYASHHRHSYHLIVHSDLPGWSAREIEIIANVARYHRRSEPKSSHRNLARLTKPDRGLVKALSAILRVADGLDRTHTQRVQAIELRVEPEAGDHDGARGTAVLTVEADEEPSVDMWGAARKSGLFHRVFGLEPRLEWRRPERPAAAMEPPEAGAAERPALAPVVVVRGEQNGVKS